MALAKQDYCEDNATYGLPVFPGHLDWTQPKWSEKTVKHFNYFGDPELHVWMDIPEILNGTWTEFNNTDTLVEIFTDISGPIDSVTVTLTDDSDNVFWEGITNSSGQIMIPYEYVTVNDSTIVAYKPEFIPLLTNVQEYPSPDTPVLEEISPQIDRDGTIKLDWNDVVNSTSYFVYRESSAVVDTSGKIAIANPTSSAYTDRGLDDGIYYYAITSVGIYGESDPSNCLFVIVERRAIPGSSIALISIVGLVSVVVIASVVANRIKLRK